MIERHLHVHGSSSEKAASFEQFHRERVRADHGQSSWLRERSSSFARRTAPPVPDGLPFRGRRERRRWRTSQVPRALQPALKELNTDMQIQGYEVVG